MTADELEDNQQDLRPRLPWNVFIYTFVASFSAFIHGFHCGIIAPAIIFIPQSIPLTTWDLSLIVSIILIGGMIGSLGSGSIADSIGRRNTLAYNNLMMMIATIAASLSQSSFALATSRLVLGWGVGVASVIPAMYITEIAPAHVRGKLGAWNQFNIWTGIIVSYFVGYWSVPAAELSWRYMFASSALLCILNFILIISILPESPRWLVAVDRTEEALKVLNDIYGDVNQSHIIRQFQILCESREPSGLTGSESDRSGYARSLLVAVGVQVAQQVSGNSAILFYSTLVFYSLGYSSKDALFYNAIACVPQLFVLIGVVFMLDRIGRRPSLIISVVGVVVALIMIGISATIEDERYHFWVLFGGMVIHRAFFAIGLGPIPTILASEILPFQIRGRGMSISLGTNWICNFIITLTFPILVRHYNPAYIYWTFAILSTLSFLFIAIFVEETGRIPLEEKGSPGTVKSQSENIPELNNLERISNSNGNDTTRPGPSTVPVIPIKTPPKPISSPPSELGLR